VNHAAQRAAGRKAGGGSVVDAVGYVFGPVGAACGIGLILNRTSRRIGDLPHRAVEVVLVGEILGHAVGGAAVSQHLPQRPIGPGLRSCRVTHARPAPLAVRNRQTIVAGLVIEVADSRVAIREGLARKPVEHVVGMGGGDTARVGLGGQIAVVIVGVAAGAGFRVGNSQQLRERVVGVRPGTPRRRRTRATAEWGRVGSLLHHANQIVQHVVGVECDRRGCG